MLPATLQKWIRNSLRKNKFKASTWPLNSLDLNPTEHLWDVQDRHVLSKETPPHHLHDVLSTSRWQIPQQATAQRSCESMPR